VKPGAGGFTLILAIQEAEIRRIEVQIVLKKNHHKKDPVEWLKGEGPEFKPQYHKKTKPKQTNKKPE
jgi:hypothetical protein